MKKLYLLGTNPDNKNSNKDTLVDLIKYYININDYNKANEIEFNDKSLKVHYLFYTKDIVCIS